MYEIGLLRHDGVPILFRIDEKNNNFVTHVMFQEYGNNKPIPFLHMFLSFRLSDIVKEYPDLKGKLRKEARMECYVREQKKISDLKTIEEVTEYFKREFGKWGFRLHSLKKDNEKVQWIKS